MTKIKRSVFLFSGLIILSFASAQTISQRLEKAFLQFESDSQLSHAISSLYVIDAKTGKVVFDRNSQVGLAAASTQKIITATTAFELLGKDYQYKTELGYTGTIDNGTLNGALIISGKGDPTLGSWRYSSTIDSVVLQAWSKAVINAGIKNYGTVETEEKSYSPNNIPDGWIQQDIGNYYGAGAYGLNWRENQYDLILRSDNITNGNVYVDASKPDYVIRQPFYNLLKSGEKGSGDNAYIYLQDGYKVFAGTIPRGEKSFKISGSSINPSEDLGYEFTAELSRNKIRSEENMETFKFIGQMPSRKTYDYKTISTHYSPSLDSIIYWFLKKSINLYGEALVKTFAYEKKGIGSTDTGIAIVKDFWKQKGVDEKELNIYDGSGLSPQNRLTTHVQVEVLKYAKGRDWFPYFYNALPEYNNMKMKSGTIADVKAFCGYQQSKDGNEYIFSFIVNNYNGSTASLVNKMYGVLDTLK